MEPPILWKVAGPAIGCRADGDLRDGHARGRESGSAARAVQRLRVRPAAPGGRRAGGRRLGHRPPARHWRAGRLARCDRPFRARRAQRADPPDARPLRQPDRRGGARPVVALVPAAGDRARDPRASVEGPAAGRARRARGAVLRLEPGEFWRDVPGLHDLFGHPGAPRGARPGRRVGAAHHPPELRRRRPRGDGDDREAGRLGRARELHPRGPERRRVGDHGPQVVLLVSVLRPLPDPRAGAGRPVVLPDRGPRPGLPHPAAEGQARHALTAVERGRVPRGTRPPGRRGGARHPDDHPDGQPHAARLPDRVGRGDALGRRPGGAPRAPPERVREALVRPAADAERAGRPRDRVGGRDRR